MLARPGLAKATADEVAVLRSILSGTDARFGQLIGQLERAPGIKRKNPTPDTFRVAPIPVEVMDPAAGWGPPPGG